MKLSEIGGDQSSGSMKLSQVPEAKAAPEVPFYSTVGEGGAVVRPSDFGEMAKGAVAGTIGVGGDIEKALFPKEPNVLPSSEGVSKFFKFKPPRDETAKGYRSMGEVLGTVAGPAGIERGVTGGLKVLGRTAERVIPGATARAQSLVSRIAQPKDPNAIGEAIRAKLNERFVPMNNARQAEFKKFLEAHDPGNKIFKTAEDQAAAEAAFEREFAEKYKELSADINRFRGKVGKGATKTEKFTDDIFTTDALNLPSRAFKSKATIREFKELAKDDAFVNETAREWVATELRRVTEPAVHQKDAAGAANAARQWLTKANQDWLSELPEIAKEAETFVDNFEAVTKTQQRMKTVAKVAGGGLAAGLGIGVGGGVASHLLH